MRKGGLYIPIQAGEAAGSAAAGAGAATGTGTVGVATFAALGAAVFAILIAVGTVIGLSIPVALLRNDVSRLTLQLNATETLLQSINTSDTTALQDVVATLTSDLAALTMHVDEITALVMMLQMSAMHTPDVLTPYTWGTFSTGFCLTREVVIPMAFVIGTNVVLSNRTIDSMIWIATNEYDTVVVPSFELILTENGVPAVNVTIVPSDWTTTAGVYLAPGWGGQLSKTFPPFTMTPGNTYGMAVRLPAGGVSCPNYARIAGSATYFKAPGA